jgi:TolA-binding protein
MNSAIELLNGFITDIPEPAQLPEALMRLGFCQRRLADLLANGEEQNKMREAARGSFERVLLDFPLHELQPHAAIERARSMMQAGDPNPAIANLRRFAAGSLKKTPVAPLAILQVATWLRGQDNRQAEAVRVLVQCRKDYEAALLKDPARAAWVPLFSTTKPWP